MLEAAGEHLGSDLLRGPVGTGGDTSKLVFKFSGESDFHIASVARGEGTGSNALRAQSVCEPLLRHGERPIPSRLGVLNLFTSGLTAAVRNKFRYALRSHLLEPVLVVKAVQNGDAPDLVVVRNT